MIEKLYNKSIVDLPNRKNGIYIIHILGNDIDINEKIIKLIKRNPVSPKLLLPMVLFLTFCLNAQNVRNSTWLFSSNSEPTPGSEGSMMIFGENKVDTFSFTMEDMIFTASSVISNSNGELLVYSNGCRIYNDDYELIQNGDSLSFGGWYVTDNCPFFGNVARNDNIMLPIGDSLVFLLHKRYKLVDEPFVNLIGHHLLISKIN